jgi:hypothetical protein
MFVIFVLAFALLVLTQLFDIKYTVKGIQKGIDVESNSTITMFFGDKPTWTQLMLHNSVIAVLMALIALAGSWLDNFAVYGLGVGSAFAYSGLHVRGGLKWRKLLAGGVLKKPRTWFEKFLGSF